MKLFKKLTSKNLLCLLFLMIFLFSASLTAAQNKVVVIPLFGDQSRAPSAVAKTGQTTTYASGDDGQLQMGVSWPVPRFIDNGDGTVTDKLTDLIWLKKVGCPGSANVFSASVMKPYLLYDGSDYGKQCGLSDGSSWGDWRLPNVRELLSVIDYATPGSAVALTQPNPFTVGEEVTYLWTSTTYGRGDERFAFRVSIRDGRLVKGQKWEDYSFTWAVKGPIPRR